MREQQRQNDLRIAVFISIVVGTIVAVVTTATFYWIYELVTGSERRAAAIAAAAPYDLSNEVKRIVNSAPNQVPEGDNRQVWMGAEAWQAGVQAGQEYIAQYPQPQNVQILSKMTTAQIWVYMQQYVSGALGVGCQYCHDINNFAADAYPQKISGRLMLLLVNDINANFIVNLPGWQNNYVQCATCHYGQPVNLPAWGPKFERMQQPIRVNVTPIDENGRVILNEADKPAELRGLVPLEEAILYTVFNYKIWAPYDPTDPISGRGTLAVTYEDKERRGPTQDQVNISQGAMNYMSWSIGEGCTYCHNSRNFYAYEETVPGNLPIQEYAVKRLKAQRMLLLTTWMAENWPRYNIIPKDIPVRGEGPLLVNQQYLKQYNGQYFAIPGCYTCHQDNPIPRAAINGSAVPEGDAGVSIFPPAIRGQ